MFSSVLGESCSDDSELYELKYPECGLCGSGQGDLLFYAKGCDLAGRRWSVVRCTRCGLVRTEPQVADPVRMEESIFQSYHLIKSEERSKGPKPSRWQTYFQRRLESRLGEIFPERLRLLRRYAPKREIYEIGCGDGSFLKFLAEREWAVDGVDLAENAIQEAERRHGLKLHCGAFQKMRYPSNSFPLVALYAVLEHVDKPVLFLKEVHRVLTQDGLLVFLVPNFQSIQSKLFRHDSYLLRLPQHLYHYTPGTLRTLLEKCSFTIVKIRHNGGVESSQSFKFSAKQAIRSRFARRGDGSVHRLPKQGGSLLPVRTGIIDLIVDPVFQLLAYLEALLGYGGTITVVASKT